MGVQIFASARVQPERRGEIVHIAFFCWNVRHLSLYEAASEES